MISPVPQKRYLFTTLILIAILILGLFIRLIAIDKFDLWFDELGTNIFSFQYMRTLSKIAEEPVHVLFLENLKNDPNSFLYYFTVFFSSIFLGNGKALRLLSMAFSVASLAGFYAVARSLFNKQISLYALLIMALSPVHVWYAQEIKVYAMVVFFSLLTVYVYLQALRTNKNGFWLAFVLSGLVTVCLSYHFITFLMISFIGVIYPPHVSSDKLVLNKAFFLNSLSQKWLISLSILSMAFLIITSPLLFSQLNFVSNHFWLRPPSGGTLLHTLKVFSLGYIHMDWKYFLGLGILFFLFVMGIMDAFEKHRNIALLLSGFLFFPVFFVFIFSRWLFPIYLTRQILFVSPFYYLFIANGLGCIRKRPLRVILLVILVLILSLSLRETYKGQVPFDQYHRLDGVFSRKQYNPLIRFFRQEFRRGDLIVATETFSLNTMLYEIVRKNPSQEYDPRQNFRLFFIPNLLDDNEKRYLRIDEEIKSMDEHQRRQLHSLNFMYNTRTHLKKVDIHSLGFKRVWVISGSFADQSPLLGNSLEVVSRFRAAYQEILSESRDGVDIKLFFKRSECDLLSCVNAK